MSFGFGIDSNASHSCRLKQVFIRWIDPAIPASVAIKPMTPAPIDSLLRANDWRFTRNGSFVTGLATVLSSMRRDA
jgi:hypothetical protein